MTYGRDLLLVTMGKLRWCTQFHLVKRKLNAHTRGDRDNNTYVMQRYTVAIYMTYLVYLCLRLWFSLCQIKFEVPIIWARYSFLMRGNFMVAYLLTFLLLRKSILCRQKRWMWPYLCSIAFSSSSTYCWYEQQLKVNGWIIFLNNEFIYIYIYI